MAINCFRFLRRVFEGFFVFPSGRDNRLRRRRLGFIAEFWVPGCVLRFESLGFIGLTLNSRSSNMGKLRTMSAKDLKNFTGQALGSRCSQAMASSLDWKFRQLGFGIGCGLGLGWRCS